MGRWDDRPARDFNPDKYVLDDWNKANNNDFDWKETPVNEHPVNCNCPKHEHIRDLTATRKQTQDTSPIKIRLCPEHFKAWHETKGDMYKHARWWQKIIVWIALKRGWLQIIELKYMNSELCYWCKFGSGGRGIKVDPITPDMPPA